MPTMSAIPGRISTPSLAVNCDHAQLEGGAHVDLLRNARATRCAEATRAVLGCAVGALPGRLAVLATCRLAVLTARGLAVLAGIGLAVLAAAGLAVLAAAGLAVLTGIGLAVLARRRVGRIDRDWAGRTGPPGWPY